MKELSSIYLLINVMTFVIYGIDKIKAMKNRYRISEKRLLIFGFFGPIGGLLGMYVFRHKTRKTKFRMSIPLFLCIHLFVLLFAGSVMATSETPSFWAEEEIKEARAKGYITAGLTGDLHEAITREQFIELIVTTFEKMFGELDSVTDNENVFTDTNNLFVVKGYVLGLIQGNDKGLFYPEQEITREEMITIFVRLSDAIELRAEVEVLSNAPNKLIFADKGTISEWALPAMNKGISNGLVRGTEGEDGALYLHPQAISTKEEAILFNLRMFKKFESNQKVEQYINAFVEVNAVEQEERTKSIGANEEKIGRVTTGVLRLRSSASTKNEDNIIGKLTRNQKVTIIGEDGDWYVVRTGGAVQGYAHKDYIQIIDSEDIKEESQTVPSGNGDADALIEYAKKFIGTPYRYGGTSLTKGIDCSSYTQQIFAPYGVSLNRSSRGQFKQGTSVSKSELQPGDLLFYSTSGSTSNISHVSIYIGDGQSIHSTTTSGVRITPAFGWMRRVPFVGAKRVL